jgi:hypothetical protein
MQEPCRPPCLETLRRAVQATPEQWVEIAREIGQFDWFDFKFLIGRIVYPSEESGPRYDTD